MLKNMRQILKTKSLEHIRFDVSFTDKIEADKRTGKKKLIRKEIEQ